MLYKANFTRQNFSVTPYIKHVIEIVFEHEELTKENIADFRKEAFNSLYIQHPEANVVVHSTLNKPWSEWIMSEVTEVDFT